MATSTCGKCDGKKFEAVVGEPANFTGKVVFIECASCGTVVGTADYVNMNGPINETHQLVKAIAEHLEVS